MWTKETQCGYMGRICQMATVQYSTREKRDIQITVVEFEILEICNKLAMQLQLLALVTAQSLLDK
jgi:hypothetical protein